MLKLVTERGRERGCVGARERETRKYRHARISMFTSAATYLVATTVDTLFFYWWRRATGQCIA